MSAPVRDFLAIVTERDPQQILTHVVKRSPPPKIASSTATAVYRCILRCH